MAIRAVAEALCLIPTRTGPPGTKGQEAVYAAKSQGKTIKNQEKWVYSYGLLCP